MSKQHITYFDFLRGIAILMVVAIHTFPESSWANTDDYLLITLRQLLNCAVPLFLALSAFFLVKKSFNKSKEIYSFWKKQIPKVYFPCIIWSIPLYLLALKSGNNPMIETVKFLFCGYSIYYFIALIIQYYLLLPLLTKISKIGWVISALVSLVCISLYMYSGIKLPLLLFAGPFYVWIMFFCQGILMGKLKRNYPIFILAILLIIALILQLIESYFLYGIREGGLGIKASAFIYSTIVIFIAFSKKCQMLYESNSNFLFSLVEYLGKISFGIYLIHMYIIMVINKFIGIEYWSVKFILRFMTSVVVIYCVKRLLPSISKYLGFL